MLFYCPNCRAEHEVEPSETITTKSNRVAYKAICPTCGQDMAEFVEEKDKVNNSETIQENESEATEQT